MRRERRAEEPRREVQNPRTRGQLPNQLTSVAHTFCALHQSLD